MWRKLVVVASLCGWLWLALAGFGLPGPPPVAGQALADSPVPPGAYLTEFLVKNVTAPLRDEYALYPRLKGGPVSPARSTTKRTYRLGDQETFTVQDLEAKRPYQVTATVIAITPHLYMFVDNNSRQNRAALIQQANQFEASIYPTTRKFFGEENSPGVDNDPHLVILNTPLKLAAGYFSADDTLLRQVNPTSNEREMFYIDLDPANSGAYLSVLAHEFQHMVHQNSLPNQDLWLNEGQSVLAQVLNGYSSGGFEQAYLGRPDTQLNNWACGACGTGRYYGAGYTWLSFIQDRFGFDTVGSISHNGQGQTGFNSIDTALYQNGRAGLEHGAVFKDFVVANYLNRRSADPAYNYKTIAARVERTTALTLNTSRDEELNQHAAAYYTVQGLDQNGFTLDFKGSPTVRLAGAGAASGQMAWWTNRGDGANTTLTRAVDLTGVSTATFRFSVWLDTEPSYDWVYVEASTDEGQTWEILPGRKYTTTTNPTGKSYGPGLTGQTLPTGLDLSDRENVTATWVQDSFDLSKFAGKKIRVRLEYLSDEGFTRQGALFDDFEIPEIGWKDDVESSENGWEASGFIRSNLTLPQRFWVQVIRRDGPCGLPATADLSRADNGRSCIQELVLDPANAGRQRFLYRQAVIVVAPYAPKTLVPARFTLRVGS